MWSNFRPAMVFPNQQTWHHSHGSISYKFRHSDRVWILWRTLWKITSSVIFASELHVGDYILSRIRTEGGKPKGKSQGTVQEVNYDNTVNIMFDDLTYQERIPADWVLEVTRCRDQVRIVGLELLRRNVRSQIDPEPCGRKQTPK